MSEYDWRSLFDGETLDNWFSTGFIENWSVEDGCIVLDEPVGGSFLCTQEYFDDFVFDFEYKIEEGCNSGVYFRWSELTDLHTGMEIQIIDDRNRELAPQSRCGALYDMATPEVEASRPPGEWNHMRLSCNGPKIRNELNDQITIDVNIEDWDTPGQNPDGTENKFTDYEMWKLPRRGRLGLQDHNGYIKFRNVRIAEL